MNPRAGRGCGVYMRENIRRDDDPLRTESIHLKRENAQLRELLSGALLLVHHARWRSQRVACDVGLSPHAEDLYKKIKKRSDLILLPKSAG